MLCPAWARAGDADLNAVKLRHTETAEAISTLYLKLRVTFEPALPTGAETIEYWRDGGEFHLKLHTERGRHSETYGKDNTVRTFDNGPTAGGASTSSGKIAAAGGPIYGDPMALCLLTVPGATQFRAPFATVLKEAGQSASVRNAKEAGNEYAVVTLTHEKAKLDIWFSKSHNYLVGKLVIWSTKEFPHPIGDNTVTAFREVAPGIYFPSQVASTNYSAVDGKVIARRTVAVQDIRLNQPVSRDRLAFKFPPNFTVLDQIQNKVWQTNSAGEIGGEAKGADGKPLTVARGTLPNPSSNAPSGAGDTFTSATTEEIQSPDRWITRVSTFMIACGIAIYVYKKMKIARTV